MSAFNDLILSDASCVAHWPLLNDLFDYKGTNHLIAADILNGHGNCSIDADGFFIYGVGWAMAGGTANFTGGTSTYLQRATGLVVGKTYTISFSITTATGSFRPLCGIGTIGTYRTGIGTYTETLVCSGSVQALIQGTGGQNGSIDNWTVREVYAGDIVTGGAILNGVSNCLQTTNSIDLSGTNKITVMMQCSILTYNTTATNTILETSVAFASNAGSFSMLTEGAVANDPLRITNFGDVGSDIARYNTALTGLASPINVFMVATSDMSLASNEDNYYQNGSLLVASSRTSVNNTGSFGNYVLYVGANAGTSQFINMKIRNLAVFSRVLSASEVTSFNNLLDIETFDGHHKHKIYIGYD
jgi:hypothetical protein